jgi:hypothetical protein
MVTGMLSALGGYVDPLLTSAEHDVSPATPEARTRQNGYGEVVAFRLLNEAVMQRTGATWKHITPFLEQRDNRRFAAASLLRMRIATFTSLRRGYLKAMPPGTKVWGWKDPRNSLLLPYWLQLFPESRILHVRRSPEGVFKSLQRRDESLHATPPVPPSLAVRLKHAATHPEAVLRKLGRCFSDPVIPITPQGREEWLSLSEQYVGECQKYQNHPGGYLEVQYEDILTDPIGYATKIADYVHADVPSAQILRATAFVLVDGKNSGSRNK